MPKKGSGKKPPQKNKKRHETVSIGRPLKPYNPEYCDLLVKHMAEGYSFDCFGAAIGDKYGDEFGVGKTLLYRWLEEYEDFRNAKLYGEQKGQRYYESMGKTGVAGQLRRVKSEKVRVVDGAPVIGPDGKPIVDREYDTAAFSASGWRLIMMNRFSFKEQQAFEHTGANGGPISTREERVPVKQMVKELKDDLDALSIIAEDED